MAVGCGWSFCNYGCGWSFCNYGGGDVGGDFVIMGVCIVQDGICPTMLTLECYFSAEHTDRHGEKQA